MKQVSIILSIFLVLGTFLYGLSIISSDNTCTSVRRYLGSCRAKSVTETVVNTWAVTTTASGSGNQEKTLDYALASYILINTSSYFIGGYETGFDHISDKWDYYEVIYSGKDSVIVDIAKGKNKVQSVTINGKPLTQDEIKTIFSRYY